jgi:hypothetical protein
VMKNLKFSAISMNLEICWENMKWKWLSHEKVY